VPVALTVDIDSFRRAMRGTHHSNPRCVALEGEIGCSVRCGIYEQRSTTCREFPFSWEDGTRNDKCDRARQAHGLAPLSAPRAAAVSAPNTGRT
jgi:Fe-S-cluster containining protein